LLIVCLFEFRRRYIADRFEQTFVVKPVHPFKRCVFDLVDVFPGSSPPDVLGLVITHDAFGHGIVVGVADVADGGFDAGLDQSLAIAARQTLTASVAMRDL
jgi:hypothetical protein